MYQQDVLRSKGANVGGFAGQSFDFNVTAKCDPIVLTTHVHGRC